MSRSSLSIKLFRMLIIGSVITAGTYVIVQGVTNHNNENVDLGPFSIRFSLDTTNSKVTREVCAGIKPSETFSCADQTIKAVRGDNFQTLENRIPKENTPYGYPDLLGYHISWDLSNLLYVKSDLIVTGQYIEDAETYPVVFMTETGLPIDTQIVAAGGTADIERASEKARSADFEAVGKQFSGWEGKYYDIQAPTNLIARYTDRFVDVAISDLDGQPLETRNLRYGDVIGSLPAIPDKYLTLDDAYYYWAIMKVQDGVLTETAVLDDTTKIKTQTNDEVFTIQLRRRKYVNVSFVSTTSNGVQIIDTRQYNYTDKHHLTAQDFSNINQVDDNGVTVDWSKYYGTIVDKDMVIYADCSLKTLNLSFEAWVYDDDLGTYTKVGGILPFETSVVKYGSVLTDSLNVNALVDYRFQYFLVSGDSQQYSESKLMSLMFQRDATISAYFIKTPATVRFLNSYLNSDASTPATVSTHIGAENVVFDALQFFVKAPEGYYFTNKWKYSAKVNGVTQTLNYDSTLGSSDTILVNSQSVVLEPIFNKIVFDVQFYTEDGILYASKKGIFYNENMVSGHKVPDYIPSGTNKVFQQWDFDPALSTLSNSNLSTPALSGIKANHGDVLAFKANIKVNTHYIYFRSDSISSTELYKVVNTGNKTIKDYIDELVQDSSYQAPTKDGFTFGGWYWSGSRPDTDVIDIGEDFNIMPSFIGNTYDVKYTLRVQTGASAYTDHVLTSNDKVQIDKFYQGDMAGITALAQNVLDTNYAALSSGYYIDSSFYLSENFNSKTIGTSTIITYDSNVIKTDPSNNKVYYHIYLRAIPRVTTIYYKAVINNTTYDLEGSNNSYEFNSNSNGYAYLWGDRFSFDSLAPAIEGVLEFVGWTDGTDEYLNKGGFIPNSKFNSSTLTLYAKFRELKVSVNFYGAVTADGLLRANESPSLSSFNSNYKVLKTISGNNGDTLTFEDYKAIINNYLTSLADSELSGQYEVTKVRLLGDSTEYDLATLDLTDITASRNYIFVLTPII